MSRNDFVELLVNKRLQNQKAGEAYFSREQSLRRPGSLMAFSEMPLAAQPVSLVEVFRSGQVSIPSSKQAKQDRERNRKVRTP